MQSDSSEEGCASADALVARRRYFQVKQREYRRRVKDERTRLREELARLQKKVNNRQVDRGMLSWEIVASVFQEASGLSKDKFERLRAHIDTNEVLISEMTRFVRACQPRPIYSIADVQTLHHHQWLVQQLYHNTERAFATFPAVDASDEFVQSTAECAGEWVNSVETCQVIWPNTLEEIQQVFLRPETQRVLCASEESNFDIERDGNTVLARGLMDGKYPWHLLQGHFSEADRFVAVFRHLQDDEAHQGLEDPNFHEVQWIQVHQLSRTHSLVRLICHRSMLLADVKDYAKQKDANSALARDDLDEKTIKHEVEAFDKDLLWTFQQQLQSTIAQFSTISI
ncbi:hypothetical protein LEN26_019496 [Aphanomyces euteiches]|nr:hypothetical protein LEN26_019496 [Aphanomyces euteiches]